MKIPTASVKAAVVAFFATLFLLSPFTAAQAAPPQGAGFPYIGADAEGKSGVAVNGMNTVMFPVYTKSAGKPDLYAYCVELGIPARTSTEAKVAGWDKFPGNNLFNDETVQRKVGWIVRNSFPEISPSELGEKAGVTGLTEKEAIGATQASIWHFTDRLALSPRGTAGDHSRISAVYDYLTGDANTGLERQGDAPSVKLTTADGKEHVAGQPAGPVRVETNQETVKVSVDTKMPIVDSDGKKVDLASVKNGSELNVDVPKNAGSGSAKFSAAVSGGGWTGHLLITEDKQRQRHGQTLIVVNGKKSQAVASAKVSWKAAAKPSPTPSEKPSEKPSETPTDVPTPTPSETHDEAAPGNDDIDSLPRTGATVLGSLGLATLLLGGGIAAVWFARRRSA